MRRAGPVLIVVLALGLAGWGATTRGVSAAGGGGVTVGSVRVAPAAIEAAALRLAGSRPRRLPAARRGAADRAIERLWLDGEAAAGGLQPARDLLVLRGEVADALAGARPGRDPGRFARAFQAFHERWRSRTRCERTYHDPYTDRCGNRAGSAEGTCRWMGEATLCAVSGGRRAHWLVVSARSRVVRLRSRARAVALALTLYQSARAVREEASRTARRARAAAAAERATAAGAEIRASERAARLGDPGLSEPALAAARAACARQVADSDPYMFAFGMQDVGGGAEGLIVARSALARRLARAAHDELDPRKLRPLVRAVAAGSRALARLAAAEAAGDRAAVAGLLARLDERTEPERALARRLDLGDCLVRPAR